MITKFRKVTLNWILSPTAFEAINQESLVSYTRPLGTAINPVNKMLARAEEMEILLPDILGVSPNSNSANWQASVSNYWHNFSLEVPKAGLPFDTSLIFDYDDHRRQKYILELAAKLGLNKVKKSKEDDASNEPIPQYSSEEKIAIIADYVMKEIPEELKYRYAHPVNVEQYLAWRYCLLSGSVGNDPTVIVRDGGVELKSTRIQFYLIDDETIAKQKATVQELKTKAVTLISQIITDKDTSNVDNILIAANKVEDINELKSMTIGDKHALLIDMSSENPEAFIATVNNKVLSETAEVKKLVIASLIRKLPNTSIHVDASDPSIVLGSNIEEVISYLKAPVNGVYANELRLKMNQLIK